MHKLVPVLVLIAGGAIAAPVPAAAQLRLFAALSGLPAAGTSGLDHRLLLVGGMGGGGTGGGMGGGGTTGGGMGGSTGGGMTGAPGGMTGAPGGMTGGGMGSYGGTPGYGSAPAYGGATGYGGRSGGGAQPYGSSETSGEGAQSVQHYNCVTQHGQCSVASSPGSLRRGASCGCLFGGSGKIQ